MEEIKKSRESSEEVNCLLFGYSEDKAGRQTEVRQIMKHSECQARALHFISLAEKKFWSKKFAPREQGSGITTVTLRVL